MSRNISSEIYWLAENKKIEQEGPSLSLSYAVPVIED
jgi:hypothetical protein